GPGLHGNEELGAFAGLRRRPPDLTHTDAMCRLVLLGMLPALQQRDLKSFGEALYDFNRRAGEMYRTVQGGLYSHSRTQEIVAFLRDNGVAGAGQSSWGPAVFGVTEPDRAAALAEAVAKKIGISSAEMVVTQARNCGATIISA